MSKVKVKVIDILDDKYAIVKKSDGICKLLETNEVSNLKINQAYLLKKINRRQRCYNTRKPKTNINSRYCY